MRKFKQVIFRMFPSRTLCFTSSIVHKRDEVSVSRQFELQPSYFSFSLGQQ